MSADARRCRAPAQLGLRPPYCARAARARPACCCCSLAWQISVPLVGMSRVFLSGARATSSPAFVDLVRKGILPVYFADSIGALSRGTVGRRAARRRARRADRPATERSPLALSPLLKFLFAIVEVAWIPIFVVWFGYGIKTIVLALVYVVFFPVLYNTLLGVRTAPQILVNAVRSLGADPLAGAALRDPAERAAGHHHRACASARASRFAGSCSPR